MKKIFVAAIIFFGTICAGCFQAKFDTIITSDGAVIQHSKIIGNALMIRQIENWKDDLEKRNPDAKAEVVIEGDLQGYKFAFDYPDIETFAKSAGDLYKVHDGKNRGVSKHKSWFFDEYDFDFYFTSPPANLPPEAEFMAQSAFSGVEFDVTIELPYSAEKNNADEISPDNKILKWHLTPLLIHGGEKFMQTQFKIWHKDKIALTAAIELLLLAATIFFFRKARSEQSVDLQKDFRFKRNVFAGLFIALTIIAVYLLIAPVNFNDADIISLAI